MRSWTLRLIAMAGLCLAPALSHAEWQNASPATDAAPEAAAEAALDTEAPAADAAQTKAAVAGEEASESASAAAEQAPEPATGEAEETPAEAGSEAAGTPSATAASEGQEDSGWDEFGQGEAQATAPAAEAPETAQAEAPPAAPAASTPEQRPIALGPMAVDAQGRRGRIHTVATGDTLWDISEAYLGTPWVWPSVWTDNDEIQNPHRINPGDHIWITAGEMRIVSQKERDRMIAAERDLAAAEADGESLPVSDEALEPAELIEGPDDGLAADDSPAALGDLPVAVPLETPQSGDMGITVHVAELEAMGFVSRDTLEAATSIVDSPAPRVWLADGDLIDLGMGEGIMEEGEEFTIFRDATPVYDVDGRLLGYHVEILGWAVVRRIEGETALAEIRMSQYEMRIGDHVIPRPEIEHTVSVRSTPEAIEGQIVYMPDSRTRMGDGDYVYLNRGSLHGFEVGSEVEVYVPGAIRTEKVSGAEVMTPDRIVGRMVLVEVKPETSVAYVVRAERELELRDRVRASTRTVVQR